MGLSSRQVASRRFSVNLVFHYEQKGWAEATVVVRFWIISVVLALLALTTLKLR